jgi:hypothetical protein
MDVFIPYDVFCVIVGSCSVYELGTLARTCKMFNGIVARPDILQLMKRNTFSDGYV